MNNKRIILQISDALCFGGKEKVIINLCNGLNKKKYSVYLVILSNDNNSLLKFINPDVNVIILPFSEKSITGIFSLYFFFRGIFQLRIILRQIAPSIIHTHTTFYRLLYVFLSIKISALDCQYFHTIHTSGTFIDPTTIYEKFKLHFERIVLKILKPKIIAVSEQAKEKCIMRLKNCFTNIVYIPNGIFTTNYYRNNNPDIKISWGFNADDIVIVYVSRICRGKNHLTLVNAFEMLSKKVEKVKLCLVGDGELRKILEEYVFNHSLENIVIFMGSTDKVNEILSISDVGVFPSEYEGMSIALLEMMATGLPIVCSDIPVFKQMFQQPESSIFFPVKDSASLAQKLELVCLSKELQLNLGNKAKMISEKYSVELMIHKHEEYFC